MHIPVSEAKAQLTDLVRRAEAGEEIILTRFGQAVARLVLVDDRASEHHDELPVSFRRIRRAEFRARVHLHRPARQAHVAREAVDGRFAGLGQGK